MAWLEFGVGVVLGGSAGVLAAGLCQMAAERRAGQAGRDAATETRRYRVSEIAEAMGCTPRWIQHRAKHEGWAGVLVRSCGGYEFEFSKLPQDIQDALWRKACGYSHDLQCDHKD